jgi:hypothetical protein
MDLGGISTPQLAQLLHSELFGLALVSKAKLRGHGFPGSLHLASENTPQNIADVVVQNE